MAKRTKFSKFRSLYDVIENLLDTYTHEGVIEILAESHNLELSVSTLRSYLYRYKKQSKELSVATDNSSGKVEIKRQASVQSSIDLKGGEPIQENDVDTSAKPQVDPTMDDLDAAIEEARKKIRNKSYNRSILNRG